MGKYNIVRWSFSQLIAYLFKTRRFISLSPPTARKHRILDISTNLITSIYGRGIEDIISIIQVFIAEFYDLKQLDARYVDIVKNYDEIIQSGKKPLIIDCGANIGLTSLYISMHFPLAKIVAIEPDKTNCDFANVNTAGKNIDVLRAAVGGRSGKCNIIDSSVNSNSFKVEENIFNTDQIDMLTIKDIINKYDNDHTPFIVKIDIEGFEKDLFKSSTDWVSLFQLLIIELHDWMLPKEANSANFLKVIARENRDFIFHNENIFSIRN
jgi:FkbM family methyltransferase